MLADTQWAQIGMQRNLYVGYKVLETDKADNLRMSSQAFLKNVDHSH